MAKSRPECRKRGANRSRAFCYGRGLRSPHDVERDGLVRVAAEAADFEIKVASIEGVAECGRWLSRTAITEHPPVPRFAGKAVGFLAGSGGSLCRGPYGRAELSRDLVPMC